MFPSSFLDTQDLAIFTDDKDRPLLLAPASERRNLCLACRSVGVIFADAGKRFCLCRKPGEDSRWDITAFTLVRHGESRGDAAIRAVAEKTGLSDIQMRKLTTSFLEEPEGATWLTLYAARGGEPVLNDDEEYLFADLDELESLGEHLAALLSPTLLLAISVLRRKR